MQTFSRSGAELSACDIGKFESTQVSGNSLEALEEDLFKMRSEPVAAPVIIGGEMKPKWSQ